MSKLKRKTTQKSLTKKVFRQQVEEKIGQALNEVRTAVGEKKFKRRIKKAGKIITDGISKKILAGSVKQPKTNGEVTFPVDTSAPAIHDLP